MRTASRSVGARARVVLLAAGVLAGCGMGTPGTVADGVDPDRATVNVSCGGPGFPIELLSTPGTAEQGDDAAAAALRDHLAQTGPDFAWLPDSGWRVAAATDDSVLFLGDDPGTAGSFATVSVGRDGASWRVTGWGTCTPQADVGPDLGVASFRVAPHEELTPDATEVDVLVTERACNSGEDARGRIVRPAIVAGPDTVTVVFAVRPRGGSQACPSNPETPFLLELAEPLGDRQLLDGSEVPARDATVCPSIAMCP